MFDGQLMHTEDEGDANVPALHAEHVMALDAPSTGEAVPEGHGTQALPSTDENVPVGQISTKRISLEMEDMVPC